MAFNVFEFSGTLSKQNVSIGSHFDAVVFLPPGIENYSAGPGSTSDLRLRVDAAELPSRSLITTPYRDYGPSREFAYNAIYPPVTISFLASRDMRERRLFNAWQEAVTGSFSDIPTNDGLLQNINYYKKYTGTVVIVKYDENGNKVLAVTLLEAYPRTVNQTSLSAGDNEPVRVSVTFQYNFFTERPRELDNEFTDTLNRVTFALSQPRRFATQAVRGAVTGAINKNISNPVARGVLNRASTNVIKF